MTHCSFKYKSNTSLKISLHSSLKNMSNAIITCNSAWMWMLILCITRTPWMGNRLFCFAFIMQDPSLFKDRMTEFMQKFDQNHDGRIEMAEVGEHILTDECALFLLPIKERKSLEPKRENVFAVLLYGCLIYCAFPSAGSDLAHRRELSPLLQTVCGIQHWVHGSKWFHFGSLFLFI